MRRHVLASCPTGLGMGTRGTLKTSWHKRSQLGSRVTWVTVVLAGAAHLVGGPAARRRAQLRDAEVALADNHWRSYQPPSSPYPVPPIDLKKGAR
jgi:hypothetical protein